MSALFLFPEAVRQDAAVEAWFAARDDALGWLAREWFDALRACGADVHELLHDGHPTACVHDAAFAYVNAFAAHVNVGFFEGAELPDPKRLLQGTGKRMRHVKLKPCNAIDEAGLKALIAASYADMKRRVAAGE